ncbi:MAG TPA: amidohydrolase [Myxococcales bacterium]|nr:amidohydrolase [Myxococcales bacterium]
MPDLLVAGTLHTLDPARPLAQAVLIRDGRFAKVGTREECERASESDLRYIELGEGCAVPGLIDAHGHPLLYARNLAEVRLGGARSEQECVDRVVQHARAVPQGSWIGGAGWDQNLWPRRDFHDSVLLSAATPEHPVALSRVDVHALWCNELALRAAGIGASTPDPPGGRILRRGDGTLTGVLIDTAMDLVRRAIPAPGGRETEEMLLRSLRALAAVGLTCVHDASAGSEVLAAYARLAERDELPVRVYAMIDGQGPGLDEEMRAWRERPAFGKLTVRSVKLFADGALGSRGAAMFEPYEDDSGNTGLWLMDPRELEERILRVAAAGYQPSVHCIGDRACAFVLEAFTRVPHGLRPRAEHLQIVRGRDVPLLKRSGATASMQPTHATSDGPWAEERLGRGTERQRGAYAWRQALDAGVPLAFGSDFPVEGIDPREGLRAAVARKTAKGAVWMPEQRLRREEALHAFTAGAARAEFAEGRRGCIREGFDADLTVFGSDVMSVHIDELPRAPVTATVVQGRVVYAGD